MDGIRSVPYSDARFRLNVSRFPGSIDARQLQ